MGPSGIKPNPGRGNPKNGHLLVFQMPDGRPRRWDRNFRPFFCIAGFTPPQAQGFSVAIMAALAYSAVRPFASGLNLAARRTNLPYARAATADAAFLCECSRLYAAKPCTSRFGSFNIAPGGEVQSDLSLHRGRTRKCGTRRHLSTQKLCAARGNSTVQPFARTLLC